LFIRFAFASISQSFHPLVHFSLGETAVAILKEHSAMNFCCLHSFWPQKSDNSTLLLCTRQQWSHHARNRYSRLFVSDALMSTPSAGVPKVRLILAPAAQPKTTSVESNTDIALIYWLSLTNCDWSWSGRQFEQLSAGYTNGIRSPILAGVFVILLPRQEFPVGSPNFCSMDTGLYAGG